MVHFVSSFWFNPSGSLTGEDLKWDILNLHRIKVIIGNNGVSRRNYHPFEGGGVLSIPIFAIYCIDICQAGLRTPLSFFHLKSNLYFIVGVLTINELPSIPTTDTNLSWSIVSI